MQLSSEQEALALRLGNGPVVRSMIRRGVRLTRANWLLQAGLTEEQMTPELEMEVPEPLQLTEAGEQPPEVDPAKA